MHQAQHTIVNSQPLQILIAAINERKNHRMAAWAARDLVTSGVRPSAADIMLRAGFVTTRANRLLALAAIQNLQASKS